MHSRKFIRDEGGQFAVIGALLMSMLMMSAFFVIEFANVVRLKTSLQDAADAAVLAAASEINVSLSSTKSVQERVSQKVSEVFFANTDIEINASNTKISTSVSQDQTRVDVKVALDGKVPPFLRYALKVDELAVNSAATASSSTKICVIGLDRTASGVVQADGEASLTGNNCAIYANSTATDSLKSNQNALVKSQMTCSSGGAQGAMKNYDPSPTLDCPDVGDPLAGRAEPVVGPCYKTTKFNVLQNTTLSPGVYCGGITVAGSAIATFSPGIYIMKDGPLQVVGNAKIVGTNVGFFLTGANATIVFTNNATIDLSGPESGDMAGLLFFESRTQDPIGQHVILTKYANKLVGTIYLPRTEVKIDANGAVSNQSPYTAIIARRVHLFGTSKVVLNTNYNQTNVPVPSGIGGSGTNSVVLVK
ncbi:MAG: TadE/TadG family type IV pilus assembly protein [Rhizobiaceae bacterium]